MDTDPSYIGLQIRVRVGLTSKIFHIKADSPFDYSTWGYTVCGRYVPHVIFLTSAIRGMTLCPECAKRASLIL